MSEDNQTLPLEEFDVRGCRGEIGLGSAGAVGVEGPKLHGTMFSSPLTSDSVMDQIRVATLSLEVLRLSEVETPSLPRALLSAQDALAHMAAHRGALEVQASDQAVMDSMFPDEEDIALEAAAAALGCASGA